MATRMEESAAAGIRTYSNYAHAFCLYFENWHALENAQDALPGFQKISQSSSSPPVALKSHLHRGFMTLKLIKMIPIDEMPELGMTAALWIPVQAYYAVHGFGLAALSTLLGDGSLPKNHSGFLSSAEDKLVKKLLPEPFSARISGGYRGCGFMDPVAEGLDFDRETDCQPNNLETPTMSTRTAHIYRCLNTTRERRISELFENQRKKNRRPNRIRRNLSEHRKIEIANKVSATTIFNYLYRTRVRSNYDDPVIFNFGTEDREIALKFVKNNREIADRLCHLLLRVIERRLKEEDYTQLINDCRSGVEWEA